MTDSTTPIRQFASLLHSDPHGDHRGRTSEPSQRPSVSTTPLSDLRGVRTDVAYQAQHRLTSMGSTCPGFTGYPCYAQETHNHNTRCCRRVDSPLVLFCSASIIITSDKFRYSSHISLYHSYLVIYFFRISIYLSPISYIPANL